MGKNAIFVRNILLLHEMKGIIMAQNYDFVNIDTSI